MDSRFRFLHPVYTELWGRGEIARAGEGEPGASAEARREANPPLREPGRGGPNERVGKLAKALPRKAAIAVYGPVP